MMRTIHPNDPTAVLHGVGPAAEKRLLKLGIQTVEELLWHVPFRYEDYRDLRAIRDLSVGTIATVTGTLEIIATRRAYRRRMTITEGLLRDNTGSIKLTWFNQPYLATNLRPGNHLMVSGRVTDRGGLLQFASPSYERLDRAETLHAGRLVPIYATTAGLTERQLRYFVSQALRSVDAIQDPLPENVRSAEHLLRRADALRWIHFPNDERQRDEALGRLKFDELLQFQLGRLLAEQHVPLHKAPRLSFHKAAVRSFVRSLPFTLTNGQRRVAWDILQDMDTQTPMYRLLEGEVGSGKTVVGAIAALNTLAAGYSVALMAPTEILARQHFLTISDLFANVDVPILLHTHAFKEQVFRKKHVDKDDRRHAGPRFTLGTHALLEPSVDLGGLGLVLVDEQHRFGVDQRRAFQKRSSGTMPHFLSLTATPIPRTLALAIAGDLSVSRLRALPKGRKPITTASVSARNRSSAYAHARQELSRGRQIFVVAPLIEPSDRLGVASATSLTEEMKNVFSDKRVGVLHGKLPSKTKDATLTAFARHELDVLVATPVVEVGIDIPNATVMIIEGAERFGLAQLHQLRGRVGRGEHASTCFLIASAETPLVQHRLHAVAETRDGFALAELDLSLRGPGDLVGTMQSGFLDFRFATLGDHTLMERARRVAETLLRHDPALSAIPEFRDQLQKSTTHRE